MTHRWTAPAARALVARAVGAIALAGLALSLAACGGDPEPAEDDAVAPLPSSSATPSPDAAAEAGTSSPASGEAPAAGIPAPSDIPMVDATGVTAPASLGTPPTAVRLDALDIDMAVSRMGIAPDGQTEVPADAIDAGWYKFGPGVGSDRGATVILAHAGTESTPRGPFSRLKNLAGGELVTIADDGGTESTYRVTAVEILEKDTLDLTPYFVRDGDPQLVLITCGGQWDEAAQSYLSNVVVTAVPV